LNKQKTLYLFVAESFLLIKYYKMTFIYCIKLDIWYNIFEKKRNFLKLMGIKEKTKNINGGITKWKL